MKKIILIFLIFISILTFNNKETISTKKQEYLAGTKTFNLTINGNGALVSNKSLKCNGTSECSIKLPSVERDGYIIDGFSTNSNDKTMLYKPNQVIKLNKDLELYVISHKDIQVSFIENHSKLSFQSDTCSIYNLEKSCTVKTPTITRSNYLSLGFSEDINASVAEVLGGENLLVNDNKTYYALTKINKDGVLEGCTGYMAVKDKLYKKASKNKSLKTLKAGTAFTIIKKSGDYFYVQVGDQKGYVLHNLVMINLSDYIPSIVYNITNASSSIYVSSGYPIKNVTGKKLYKAGKVYNNRLKKDEYIAPVMYSFAKKILKAEKEALANGYTLKIYDSYRPNSVTKDIYKGLSSLYNKNKTVKKNINYSNTNKSSWGTSWFLARGVSTHNTGSAIDVTMVKTATLEELKMPTDMHELSSKAVKYKNSGTTSYSKEMLASSAAKKMDKIMKNAGMQTLASEWWHFQENTSYNRIKGYSSTGCNFQPTKVLSY